MFEGSLKLDFTFCSGKFSLPPAQLAWRIRSTSVVVLVILLKGVSQILTEDDLKHREVDTVRGFNLLWVLQCHLDVACSNISFHKPILMRSLGTARCKQTSEFCGITKAIYLNTRDSTSASHNQSQILLLLWLPLYRK